MNEVDSTPKIFLQNYAHSVLYLQNETQSFYDDGM